MSEKFNGIAKQVFELANREAIRKNHDCIGTEDILIGLYLAVGVGYRILSDLGLTIDRLRGESEMINRSGPEMDITGWLPQSLACKRVIEYSLDESCRLRHNYVGPEHILLGLTREKKGVIVTMFKNLGIQPDDLRQRVLNLLGHGTETVVPETNPDCLIGQNTVRILTRVLVEAGKTPQDLLFLLNSLDSETLFRQTFIDFIRRSQFVERKTDE